MTEFECAWLAGLLEGEGSFISGPPSKPNEPRIIVEMTDEDVVRRAAQLTNGYVLAISARRERWKNSFRLTIKGRRAVVLMQQLRPLMGVRRQGQIDRAVESYEPNAYRRMHKLSDEQFEAIRQSDKSGVELAKEFEVSRMHVSRIRNGYRRRT